MADAQTIAESDRVNRRMVETDNHYSGGVTVGLEANNTRYPAKLFKNSTEADTKVQLTKQLKDSGFGDTIITDRLVDYFYDKSQEEEFAKREKWIAENFDTTNPVVKQWLDKVAPGFTSRREAFAMKRLKDQERLVRLSFHGPQSEEDLDFMYHIATGRIDLTELSRHPWLQDPELPGPLTDNYVRGLFSPRRWTGEAAVAVDARRIQGAQRFNRLNNTPSTFRQGGNVATTNFPLGLTNTRLAQRIGLGANGNPNAFDETEIVQPNLLNFV